MNDIFYKIVQFDRLGVNFTWIFALFIFMGGGSLFFMSSELKRREQLKFFKSKINKRVVFFNPTLWFPIFIILLIIYYKIFYHFLIFLSSYFPFWVYPIPFSSWVYKINGFTPHSQEHCFTFFNNPWYLNKGLLSQNSIVESAGFKCSDKVLHESVCEYTRANSLCELAPWYVRYIYSKLISFGNIIIFQGSKEALLNESPSIKYIIKKNENLDYLNTWFSFIKISNCFKNSNYPEICSSCKELSGYTSKELKSGLPKVFTYEQALTNQEYNEFLKYFFWRNLENFRNLRNGYCCEYGKNVCYLVNHVPCYNSGKLFVDTKFKNELLEMIDHINSLSISGSFLHYNIAKINNKIFLFVIVFIILIYKLIKNIFFSLYKNSYISSARYCSAFSYLFVVTLSIMIISHIFFFLLWGIELIYNSKLWLYKIIEFAPGFKNFEILHNSYFPHIGYNKPELTFCFFIVPIIFALREARNLKNEIIKVNIKWLFSEYKSFFLSWWNELANKTQEARIYRTVLIILISILALVSSKILSTMLILAYLFLELKDTPNINNYWTERFKRWNKKYDFMWLPLFYAFILIGCPLFFYFVVLLNKLYSYVLVFLILYCVYLRCIKEMEISHSFSQKSFLLKCLKKWSYPLWKKNKHLFYENSEITRENAPIPQFNSVFYKTYVLIMAQVKPLRVYVLNIIMALTWSLVYYNLSESINSVSTNSVLNCSGPLNIGQLHILMSITFNYTIMLIFMLIMVISYTIYLEYTLFSKKILLGCRYTPTYVPSETLSELPKSSNIPFQIALWLSAIVVSTVKIWTCSEKIFTILSHGFLFSGLLYMILLFIVLRRYYSVLTFESEENLHNSRIRRALKIGFILFIVSEIMFFFSLFWAFFHSALAPSVVHGCEWPPLYKSYAKTLSFYKLNHIHAGTGLVLPGLNTALLLTSGLTLTISHYFYKKSLSHWNNEIKEFEYRNIALVYLTCTLLCGFYFSLVQLCEYSHCSFTFLGRIHIYGSLFYILTGFHGIHVLIGSILLILSYFNVSKKGNGRSSLLFEFSIWYWHFVDVVWVFLFLFLYVWGS